MAASDIYTKSWLTDDTYKGLYCTGLGEGTSADTEVLLILDWRLAALVQYLGP